MRCFNKRLIQNIWRFKGNFSLQSTTQHLLLFILREMLMLKSHSEEMWIWRGQGGQGATAAPRPLSSSCQQTSFCGRGTEAFYHLRPGEELMMTEKSGMIVSGSGWVPLSFYRKGGRRLRVLITLKHTNAQFSQTGIRGLFGIVKENQIPWVWI